MPYKDPEKQSKYLKTYNKEYYSDNHEDLLEYRKSRREKDRQLWREWYARKKDTERRQKIDLGGIYRSFNKYN